MTLCSGGEKHFCALRNNIITSLCYISHIRFIDPCNLQDGGGGVICHVFAAASTSGHGFNRVHKFSFTFFVFIYSFKVYLKNHSSFLWEVGPGRVQTNIYNCWTKFFNACWVQSLLCRTQVGLVQKNSVLLRNVGEFLLGKYVITPVLINVVPSNVYPYTTALNVEKYAFTNVIDHLILIKTLLWMEVAKKKGWLLLRFLHVLFILHVLLFEFPLN